MVLRMRCVGRSRACRRRYATDRALGNCTRHTFDHGSALELQGYRGIDGRRGGHTQGARSIQTERCARDATPQTGRPEEAMHRKFLLELGRNLRIVWPILSGILVWQVVLGLLVTWLERWS